MFGVWDSPAAQGWESFAAQGDMYGGAGSFATQGDTYGDVESLVAQVKELQRRDPNAKMQWIAYTDSAGSMTGRSTTRDPAKYDAEFLQGFLANMSSGEAPPSADDGSPTLAEAIKLMQKRSSNFKRMWTSFCSTQGGGTNDPMRHDAAFHANFFDQLATSAASGGSPTGGGENPTKRMRTDSSMAMGGDTKEALVQQVKNFQKMGTEQKELWAQFADTFLEGVRDPARHDLTTLQAFCEQIDLSSLPGADDGTDPEKQDLVERIKSFQRMGPENKENWNAFCGSTKDPNRHGKQQLEQFCTMLGI